MCSSMPIAISLRLSRMFNAEWCSGFDRPRKCLHGLALWHVLVVRAASGAANRANWHQQSVSPGHVSTVGTIAPDDPRGRAKNPSTSTNGYSSGRSPAETGTTPDSTVPNWRRLVPIGQSAAGMDPFPPKQITHTTPGHSLHRFSTIGESLFNPDLSAPCFTWRQNTFPSLSVVEILFSF